METEHLPVNRKDSIAVARLLDEMTGDLGLELIGGFQGIGKPVFTADINRPGLALSGYLDYFASDRIQILGNTEIHFMEQLSTADLKHRIEQMCSFEVPAFLLSRSLKPRSLFMDMCNRRCNWMRQMVGDEDRSNDSSGPPAEQRRRWMDMCPMWR